jgi:hypothetical protein
VAIQGRDNSADMVRNVSEPCALLCEILGTARAAALGPTALDRRSEIMEHNVLCHEV